MIRKFHVLYVGQIELENIGLKGTPANERRYLTSVCAKPLARRAMSPSSWMNSVSMYCGR